MAAPHSTHSFEQERHAFDGWLVFVLVVLWFIAAVGPHGRDRGRGERGRVIARELRACASGPRSS